MVNNDLLIHELQLGESLNQCVHSERRADFALMLAMLVEDAREFSQFKVPQTVKDKTPTTEQQLRQQFDLPKKAKLAITQIEEISQYNQADKIENKQLLDIKLSDALAPKPLCFRDDKHFIETKVKSNTTLFCQQTLLNNEQQEAERMKMNANEWLKAIKTSQIGAVEVAA